MNRDLDFAGKAVDDDALIHDEQRMVLDEHGVIRPQLGPVIAYDAVCPSASLEISKENLLLS